MMGLPTVPALRLLGFEVRVHLSWAIIIVAVAATVAGQLGSTAPDLTVPLRWVIGGLVAVAFLVSAVVHELGHAVVARRAGMRVEPIIVFFFGGAATASDDAPRARDEVAAALAGPAVSLGLGVVLVIAAGAGAALAPDATVALGQVALVLGVLNLVLGAINLVPAYPLDGGRIVRGLAWLRTGDVRRATRIAARSGRLTGWVLIGAGLVVIVLGSALDGVMLGLCGWFLTSAARGVDRRAVVDDLLDGLRVEEVMDRDVSVLPPGLTLDAFGDQLLDGSAAPSIPVVGDRGFLGMIGIGQLRRLRRQDWPQTRVADVMVAAAGLPRIGPETPLRTVFDDLRRSGLDGLPVMGSDGLAGVVTRRAVIETLRTRAQLQGVTLP
jgi:Zn-dependent protease